MFLNWNVSSRKGRKLKMGKFNFNEAAKDVVNMINSMVNEQEVKYYIKKGGHWNEADRLDLLFLSKREFVKRWPRKRGDLLMTNSWQGYILAIFVGNKNNKDIRYTINQLNEAEKMSPDWVRENSNLEA